MSSGLVVGDGEHLEEEPEVLDVVGVVVVVDVEPVHGVGLGVAVADGTGGHPAGDEDGAGVGAGPLGGDEAEVIVALHVLLLELVEVLDAVDAELVEVLLELRGELGHVRRAGLALPVGRDEVVGLPQNLVDAHGHFAGEGAGTLEAGRRPRGRGGDCPASAGRDGRADGGGGEAHGAYVMHCTVSEEKEIALVPRVAVCRKKAKAINQGPKDQLPTADHRHTGTTAPQPQDGATEQRKSTRACQASQGEILWFPDILFLDFDGRQTDDTSLLF